MSGRFEDVKALEDRYLLATYAKFPIALVRGEGAYVEDSEGKRYLDLYGGHAVAIAGHCPRPVVDAIAAQARDLLFYSNVAYFPARAEAARALVEACYGTAHQVFFVNSGTEANEAALKTARRLTGRERVIAMRGGFHGRTVGSLSATGVDKYRQACVPNMSASTDFVEFGDVEAVEAIDPSKTAAIILEPIPSMAGVRVAPAEYYRALRRHATEHGIFLIFDEVQSGIGRTGRWFAGMHWDVEPDMVTLAKGLGGGFPVGALVVDRAIAEATSIGDHGSTFGGGPLAMVAVSATLDVIRRDGLVENARAVGEEIRTRLAAHPRVRDVRGLGLLIGIDFDRPAREIRERLLAQGILVGTSVPPETVRLLPPLTIGAPEVERFFEALETI
ncbi:MAG: aminotransferase class III-fold pyridoxal phosphate-dependent enzyme [Planctomycetes bacterium]|nr:aminotransferase class III-fold pyridoxal phosphate-dependent enzyme [Planctomycetota bacterium]